MWCMRYSNSKRLFMALVCATALAAAVSSPARAFPLPVEGVAVSAVLSLSSGSAGTPTAATGGNPGFVDVNQFIGGSAEARAQTALPSGLTRAKAFIDSGTVSTKDTAQAVATQTSYWTVVYGGSGPTPATAPLNLILFYSGFLQVGGPLGELALGSVTAAVSAGINVHTVGGGEQEAFLGTASVDGKDFFVSGSVAVGFPITGAWAPDWTVTTIGDPDVPGGVRGEIDSFRTISTGINLPVGELYAFELFIETSATNKNPCEFCRAEADFFNTFSAEQILGPDFTLVPLVAPDTPTTDIPEPATLWIFAFGLMALAFRPRMRPARAI